MILSDIIKTLPSRGFAGILILTAFFLPFTEAREDLILSLEDVIGKPRENPELLKNRPRETFYSVVKSEENPEMERLFEQQQRGFPLTEDEMILLEEYQMGGNVSGSNSVIRRIYPPVLNWLESRIKVVSGERYSFINCVPNADGSFPVALVLDPEIAQQFVVGIEEYNQVVRRMPVTEDLVEGVELPWEEPFRGRYITHSPLGNQLMSHAVSVIIPIRESLEKANDISIEDWKSVLDYYTDKKYLDSKCLFLVATKEFADLAIRLAGAYPFVGLILEEPEKGLFGTQLPTDTGDAVKMLALQETYSAQLKNLECPTLLFRQPNNPSIPMNDTLILKTLLGWQRPIFLSLTDYPFRSLENSEKEVKDPRFVYDVESAKKLAQRMLYFIQQEGEASLYLLPEKSTETKSIDRTVNNLNLWDRMNERFDKRLDSDDQSTQTTN